MDNISGYEDALRSADGTASDMAATMNDNLSGDLANMNSAFEELKLKIFDGMEEPLRSASQFVTNTVIPAITMLIDNMDTVVPIFAGAATAIGLFVIALNFSSIVSTVTNVLSGLKTAVLTVNAAMEANPIMLIVSLIAGLVVALVALWNTNEDFRNGVIAVWEAIKTAVSTALDAISTAVSDVWNAIVDFLGPILEDIETTFTNVWEAIKTAVSTALDAISTAVSDVWNAIVDFLGPILEDIETTFTNILERHKNNGNKCGQCN
jgi:phage-related protein